MSQWVNDSMEQWINRMIQRANSSLSRERCGEIRHWTSAGFRRWESLSRGSPGCCYPLRLGSRRAECQSEIFLASSTGVTRPESASAIPSSMAADIFASSSGLVEACGSNVFAMPITQPEKAVVCKRSSEWAVVPFGVVSLTRRRSFLRKLESSPYAVHCLAFGCRH